MDPFPSKHPVSDSSSLPQCTSPPVERVKISRWSPGYSPDCLSGLSKTRLLAVGDLEACIRSSKKLILRTTNDDSMEPRLHAQTRHLNINDEYAIVDFDVMNYNIVVLVNSLWDIIVHELLVFGTDGEIQTDWQTHGRESAFRMLQRGRSVFRGSWAGQMGRIEIDVCRFHAWVLSSPGASIISISGDDNRVLTSSLDRLVQIWDVASFIGWKSFRFPNSSSVSAIMWSKQFLICVYFNGIFSSSVYTADTCKKRFEMDH